MHPEHHNRLVAARGSDTTRSGVFGPEMPAFNPMRLMRVRPTEEFEGRLEDVPTDRSEEPVIGQTTFMGQPHEKRRFDVILPTPETTGDYEEMAWLMGQGVGLVKDIRSAYGHCRRNDDRCRRDIERFAHGRSSRMTTLIRDLKIKGASTGPLNGETLAVKANIAVEGTLWDGASPALAGMIASSHATTVQRAINAGANLVGQANMHELAFGITSDNTHFGPVQSPFGGMAGGSSGGTAAAIASGTATIGLGTDTGGFWPHSCCILRMCGI